MITLLKNGKLYDPAHSKDGVVEDIYIRDGRIVAKPNASENIAQTYDLTGKVIMAGAIDMHSHIGGGKVNIARMMLPAIASLKRIFAHLIVAIMPRQRRRKSALSISKWATRLLSNPQ